MIAYVIVIAEMASFSTVMTIDGKILCQEHVHSNTSNREACL